MKSSRFRTIPGLCLPTFNPADLQKLCDLSNQFGIDCMRFTPGSQLAVKGVAEQDMPDLIDQLQLFMKPMVNNGISLLLYCPGCNDCTHGLRDTTAMSEKISGLVLPLPLPSRLKIAVAGCPRCCTMPRVRDVGLIPTQNGWQISFGGNGGAQPRIGDIIATGLSDDRAVELVNLCLAIYQRDAGPNMRTSRFIEDIGIEAFRKKIKETDLP